MQNLEIVHQLYQAFGQGDMPTLLGALDPNIEWINPGPAAPAYFGTHQGPTAVARNIFGFLAENLRFDVFEPREFFTSNDKVVVLLHMEAVAVRSGTRVINDVVHVFTFSAGKVVRFHDFQNSYALAEALR
jgi:ketosteroid isomerase-like protein